MIFELSSTDKHFAAFIAGEAGKTGCASPLLPLAASLLSSSVGSGHICLDLAGIAGRAVQVDGCEELLPGLPELERELSGSCVVGPPGAFRPLVLDAGRLYLYRYWKYESALVRAVLEKAGAAAAGLNEALLSDGVGRFFGPGGEGTDWQRVAALAALWKRFCVISGGPGTGKTFTVIKILALLLEQAGEKPLRIALAAPTGKAAARLKESIRRMKEKLHCSPEVRDRIPEEVTTIHRLLGVRSGSIRFQHDEKNPLPYDVVIIDEASMVALPLMAKLAVSLEAGARFILLGDRDQLASVEAGAVLGDLCGGGRAEPFSAGFSKFLERVAGEKVEPSGAPDCPLADTLVVLKKNYRFAADSGIGAVARAVNEGDGAGALKLLRGSGKGDVAWRDVPPPERLRKELAELVVAGYTPYLGAGSPGEALALFDRFRILCALRQGPYGVSGINEQVEEILAQKGLIQKNNRWYRGRPVMITVNDYNMRLFNGDIGIVLPDAESGGEPRVHFPSPEGGVRKVAPVRLPEHETVYAMTVHKSQGSEFERVLMLLPGHDTEALTRELIYTGITRARDAVEVWGDGEVFTGAVLRRVERASGLGQKLWQD
jgi:exodeoxyribonuclease V alpha subunit